MWFQNKRRSMKKKSVAWTRATTVSENAHPLAFGTVGTPTPANPARQRSQLRRHSSFSLDSVVSSREKKENQPQAQARPPLTPRRPVVKARRPQTAEPSGGNGCLWDHLLSSPRLPPSSPSKEKELLSTLPPQAKTLKSLEWACAKDRAGRRRQEAKPDRRALDKVEEESRGVPELDLDALPGDDTDGEDELVTPDTSVLVSTVYVYEDAESLSIKDSEPPAEDVEAAMALLGFKVNNT